MTKTEKKFTLLQEIVSFAKEYGFIFPSSEIYEGVQAVYDYGQNGALLKQNIKELWWKTMTQLNQNIVGIDSAIFMHPTVWKASGHVDSFNDPMIDNKDSKQRYRVDHLIENFAEDLKTKGKIEKSEKILTELENLLKSSDLKRLDDLIEKNKIKCKVSGTCNWTNVRQFNLMFSTQIGAIEGEDSIVYLRPESAQGIFVNFHNVQKTSRLKVPFGIAQIGKAFRNEIVARQFIFRMREFEQMEMQFFIKPGSQKEWYEKWKQSRMKFFRSLEIDETQLRFKDHAQLSHYADAAVDIEYDFPIGFKEVEGIHSRTDFDLSQHAKFSKKNLEYFDAELNEKYIPYVVETSVGCDRLFLVLLCNSFVEETSVDEKGDEKTRGVLKLPYSLSPYKVCVLPLMKKDGIAEKALSIFDSLKTKISVTYDETQSIGKRYARQDMIGTPYCITIDYQTLEDNSVTVRDRNTTNQERICIESIEKYIQDNCSMTTLLEKNL